MDLNSLKDRPGAAKARKRIGRGIGSGKGKTAGRGVKGQKSRSGVTAKSLRGEQTDFWKQLPKRGFTQPNRKDFVAVNIGRVQSAIDAGKLASDKPIDAAALIGAGVIRRERDGVRLLGKGALTAKADFVVAGASEGARQAVEAAGGSISMPDSKAPGGD